MCRWFKVAQANGNALTDACVQGAFRLDGCPSCLALGGCDTSDFAQPSLGKESRGSRKKERVNESGGDEEIRGFCESLIEGLVSCIGTSQTRCGVDVICQETKMLRDNAHEGATEPDSRALQTSSGLAQSNSKRCCPIASRMRSRTLERTKILNRTAACSKYSRICFQFKTTKMLSNGSTWRTKRAGGLSTRITAYHDFNSRPRQWRPNSRKGSGFSVNTSFERLLKGITARSTRFKSKLPLLLDLPIRLSSVSPPRRLPHRSTSPCLLVVPQRRHHRNQQTQEGPSFAWIGSTKSGRLSKKRGRSRCQSWPTCHAAEGQ